MNHKSEKRVYLSIRRCKRDKLKRSTRQGTDVMVAPRLHKHLQRLQTQARLRRCALRILPPHFTRRKENTSSYDFKTKVRHSGSHLCLFYYLYFFRR